MNRSDKEAFISELRSEFDATLGAILVDYQGINVKKSTEIRRAFREQGVSFKVVKNTLARIAAQGTGLEAVLNDFSGPIAIAYSTEDRVAPAKIAEKFQKEEPKFEIRCGYVGGKRLDLEAVKVLSSLPSKDELRAKLLSVLNAPATQLVRVLNEPGSSFVRLLAARQASLEG